jgi:phenylacetate-CoA ligase
MKVPRTPLHAWLSLKLGLKPGQDPDPQAIAGYQLAMLRETIAHVREHSPFHRERLTGLPDGFPHGLQDVARLPFTTADDLREHHLAMLCVSQDQVARVVTLHTSGTTDRPKRIYFSDDDLELTLDFFHHGMSTMVKPGGRVLILLPGTTPDSVGDLLARALQRMQFSPVIHGPVLDPGAALRKAWAHGADCLVGIPVQVLAMAEHPEAKSVRGAIKSVLLTTDYVPKAIADRIHSAWGCEVFEHYGTTEIGLGGGVDCRAHAGYHLRGADLYYEAVDPESGEPLPIGHEGELVVSTLTRQAMPFLRYRTGDRGRLLPAEDCPCGGITPRLARVPGRLANRLELGNGDWLPMRRMDEALFAVPGVLDYRASFSIDSSKHRLDLTIQAAADSRPGLLIEAEQAITAIPLLGQRLKKGDMLLGPLTLATKAWTVDGSSKRTFLPPRG